MLNQVHGNSLEEIGVVQEYLDIFPEELPDVPPDHDIEFIIDLLPGTPPISMRPYRMPANELGIEEADCRVVIKSIYPP
jgi:hypothetical protein